MAGKRDRKRPGTPEVEEKEKEKGVVVEESNLENPSALLSSNPPESREVARSRLRERWELACVLNFLRVFKPVLDTKLEISAEEIETALITPNGDLSQLHISLLKGIPPVNKNLTGPDAWVTILCKKLASWWPWVAEEEFPLKVAHGEEISRYKDLDSVNRLVILKALCELRAVQDDAVRYINDALKQGTEVSTFRRNRIGGDGTGVSFWNDGDAVLGYRLYREVTKVDLTPRKGKGRLVQPPASHQWETLATSLEEFRQISDKLSSSEIVGEVAVGNIVATEIIPILEEIEKKKERALKRQQKQVMLLNGYFNSYQLGGTRSCRNRKPVKYTFDEYDKSIDEAIQLNNRKRKTAEEPKHRQKAVRREGDKDVNSNGNSLNNGAMEHTTDDDEDDKFKGVPGDSDNGDEDYDDKNDESDNDANEDDDEYNNSDRLGDSNTFKERNNVGPGTRAQKKKGHLARNVVGLRRSTRTTSNVGSGVGTRNHAEMREQRSHNSHSDSVSLSDSDDGSSSKSSPDKTSDAGKESLDVLEGLLEESEEDEENEASEEGEESEASEEGKENEASEAGEEENEASEAGEEENEESEAGEEENEESEAGEESEESEES